MPTARFTVLTLGVADMRAAIAFYAALGFERRLAATGEEGAFFATGASVPRRGSRRPVSNTAWRGA